MMRSGRSRHGGGVARRAVTEERLRMFDRDLPVADATLTPTPGLADLKELVARTTSAGSGSTYTSRVDAAGCPMASRPRRIGSCKRR
jgi:hypothetical protein